MTKAIKKTSQKVIDLIEESQGGLTEDDKKGIQQTVSFHFYEPSVIAERISHEFDVPYQHIYNLL